MCLRSQGRHDQLGLRRRHHLVLDALQDQHRGRQQLGEVDRAPRAVRLLRLGPRPDHRVLVPALELVRVALGERHEVGDPEVGGARREHVGEGQRADHDVAAGAAAAHEEPPAVDVAPVDQEPGGVHAVLQVDDAPLAVQPLPVGTPVARRTAVVHVHHGEPAGGPVLQLQIERRCGVARRAAVRGHDQGRPIVVGPVRVGVRRRVEQRMRPQPALRREVDRLGHREEGVVHRDLGGGPDHVDRPGREVEPHQVARAGRGAGDEHDRGAGRVDAGPSAERVVGQVEIGELARVGIETAIDVCASWSYMQTTRPSDRNAIECSPITHWG